MEERAVYYGIDVSSATVEYGEVDSGQALKAIDERFAGMKEKYDSAEEALAATLFGFSKTGDTFIEITLNGPESISFKLECPKTPDSFIFRSLFSSTLELCSRDELSTLVTLFIRSPIEEFRAYLAGFPGRACRRTE